RKQKMSKKCQGENHATGLTVTCHCCAQAGPVPRHAVPVPPVAPESREGMVARAQEPCAALPYFLLCPEVHSETNNTPQIVLGRARPDRRRTHGPGTSTGTDARRHVAHDRAARTTHPGAGAEPAGAHAVCGRQNV